LLETIQSFLEFGCASNATACKKVNPDVFFDITVKEGGFNVYLVEFLIIGGS
jgi:hypothetical protein